MLRSRLSWWSRLTVLTFCAAAPLSLGGCMFLDDFGKYRVIEEQPDPDGGAADGATLDDAGEDAAMANQDAGSDGGEDAGPGKACVSNLDCNELRTDCQAFFCLDSVCQPTSIRQGKSCTLEPDDKCMHAVCVDGACEGTPKDCSQFDTECTHGVCNKNTGSCSPKNVREGETCDDGLFCSVNETCMSGVCQGVELDCSELDDDEACTTGICDELGEQCVETTAAVNTACDDFDPCTAQDFCNASGSCVSNVASSNSTVCNDYDDCTLNDHCDGAGQCISGGNAPNGTACDLDQECVTNKTCLGGACGGGSMVTDGTPCHTDCRSNDECQSGNCMAATGGSSYFPTCQYNWCGDARLCETRFMSDGSCDCGCGFADPDCSDCSSWMCERNWCDNTGSAVTDCDDDLKNDGKCDCGCQFEDPDCYGGNCCAATGVAGCGDQYIEDCLCTHGNGDPTCCGATGGTWDAACVQLAQELGCMACP